MTTPRVRTLVSLGTALTFSLLLGACARATSGAVDRDVAPEERVASALRFDNSGRDYVHVYLIGQKREWLLGRVQPGARATLRVPDDALAAGAGWTRLAVLSGQRVSQRVASDPHATMALAQPTTDILAQRWTFSLSSTTGQLRAFAPRLPLQ